MFIQRLVAVAAIGIVGVFAATVGVYAQQPAARSASLAATPEQIEASLTRLMTIPLSDSASAKALQATLAAAESAQIKPTDVEGAKRMKALMEMGRYQLDSWQELNRWAAAQKEWQAKPGTVAEKGPAPAYNPPLRPGQKPPEPPPPVDVNRFDAVADAKAFSLYRELDCLDFSLSQLQIIRADAAQFGDPKVGADDMLMCPIVARCEALTPESLASQLAIRDDLPMLSGAMKKCDGAPMAGLDNPMLAGIMRRISRLSMPEEVNRLRMDYIAAKASMEPAKVASAVSE